MSSASSRRPVGPAWALAPLFLLLAAPAVQAQWRLGASYGLTRTDNYYKQPDAQAATVQQVQLDTGLTLRQGRHGLDLGVQAGHQRVSLGGQGLPTVGGQVHWTWTAPGGWSGAVGWTQRQSRYEPQASQTVVDQDSVVTSRSTQASLTWGADRLLQASLSGSQGSTAYDRASLSGQNTEVRALSLALRGRLGSDTTLSLTPGTTWNRSPASGQETRVQALNLALAWGGSAWISGNASLGRTLSELQPQGTEARSRVGGLGLTLKPSARLTSSLQWSRQVAVNALAPASTTGTEVTTDYQRASLTQNRSASVDWQLGHALGLSLSTQRADVSPLEGDRLTVPYRQTRHSLGAQWGIGRQGRLQCSLADVATTSSAATARVYDERLTQCSLGWQLR
ncbi:hypothetical protein [Ideonella livida]|uniref:Autotransporter domain-containing protein n=1 Tax=Ideonella livida TaxID=2707176 RepID=A0A7C9PGA5_9BURK|nr:hypothetical protein [Ideonella livida]NDY91155.1 hypothetical protein [Ideonella livida]